MNDIMKTLLSLSFAGSLLILLLLLCRIFLKEKMSRQWQYYVWLIVIARLLLPFTPETSLMGHIFQGNTSVVISDNFLSVPEHQTENTSNSSVTSKQQPYNDKQVNTANKYILTYLYSNIRLVWLIIALMLLIRKITVYQGFVHYVKAGQTPVSNTQLLDQLSIIEEQAHIKKAVELCVNPLVSSPLLIGFFRPCIVLPGLEINENQLQYIMLHELTHYRRRDLLYKWLVQLTVCIHWFNPLVYLMQLEMNKDCEFSCDEAIISKLDDTNKKDYGNTLLEAMYTSGNYKENLAYVTLNENKKILKERLGAIMHFKQKSKWVVIASLVLTILIGAGGNAIGAYASPRYEYPSSSKTVSDSSTYTNLLYDNGVYYVICDGADENDRPASSVTDGYIGIVLVREDSYSSLGPFEKSDLLVEEVEEQCRYMQEKSFLTQADAGLLIEAAREILASYSSDTKIQTATSLDEEYAIWGISKRDKIFYYENKCVGILMDVRADNSFQNFYYQEGTDTVDLRVSRDENNSIVNVEYLSQAEKEELLSDLESVSGKANTADEDYSDNFQSLNDNVPEDISRLTKDELPVEVLEALQTCYNESWYLLEGKQRQYIYYNSLPSNYAYQFEPDKNSLKIVDMKIKLGNADTQYVLLSIPLDSDPTVTYNNNVISYDKVPVL